MYKRKLTPIEALNEIKLRMSYDAKKTLTENLLLVEDDKIIDLPNDINTIHREINAPFSTDEQEVVDIVKKYTTKQDLQKLIDEYKKKYNTDLATALSAISKYSDKVEFEDLRKHLEGIGITWEVVSRDRNGGEIYGFGGLTTTKSTEQPNTGGAKQSKDKNAAAGSNTPNVQAPADLDVKHFQQWLDDNKGEWAWSPRQQKYYKVEKNPNRGYGKFGPSTQKMWNDATVKDEYLKSKGQNKSFAPDVESDEDVSTTQPF